MKFNLPGFRLIAVFEFIKGAVVLLAGLGALEYIHRNLEHIGEAALGFTGLGHEAHTALLAAVDGITNQRILLLAIAVLAYATVRFVEAYGLWYEKNWARWLGIISGGLYLPYEFYILFQHFNWIKLGIIFFNMGIVWYLLRKDLPAKPQTSIKSV